MSFKTSYRQNRFLAGTNDRNNLLLFMGLGWPDNGAGICLYNPVGNRQRKEGGNRRGGRS